MEVREFAIAIPIALPKPGRMEEEINKISQTFTSHFQSMMTTQNKSYAKLDVWNGRRPTRPKFDKGFGKEFFIGKY